MTYKSMDTQTNAVMACNQCVNDCLSCISQMENCPNRNAMHDQCIASCKTCIADCTQCVADCSGNTPDSQTINSCRQCSQSCMNCVEMLEKCAESCPICKEACQSCSESCGICSEMCDMSTGDMKMAQSGMAAKFAIKAIGDWEIDVLAIPFDSKDSDGQWFDRNTDIMPDTFNSPLIVYQHGVKQGARGMQDKPILIGQSVPGSLQKRSDGWHIKVILDKASQFARATMEAVKQGMAAVSSGSVLHLARLDVGGRLIPYEKDRPGRIAVWPFAELSLWERGGGNMMPANRFAVALPAMKAFYRDAGQPFPDLQPDHTSRSVGTTPEKRAQIAQLRAESKKILSRTDKYFLKEK